jgi:hypothetical protein
MDSIFLPDPIKPTGYDLWKPMGNRNCYMIYADRILALVGSSLFTFCQSFGIVLVPAYLFSWYWMSVAAWKQSVLYMLVISFTSCQCILAYLRQGYFYDAYGTYAFLGGIFALFFITIGAISMAYIGVTASLNTCITILQLGQVIHAIWSAA